MREPLQITCSRIVVDPLRGLAGRLQFLIKITILKTQLDRKYVHFLYNSNLRASIKYVHMQGVEGVFLKCIYFSRAGFGQLGGGGVRNVQKHVYVFYGRPLTNTLEF